MDQPLIVDAVPIEVSLLPGGHLVLLTGDPLGCVGLRRLGLEVRDTLLVMGLEGLSFAFLSRRPLEGTVAENVLRYGTGGLWIDGCRVKTDEAPSIKRREAAAKSGRAGRQTSGIVGGAAKSRGRIQSGKDAAKALSLFVESRAGELLGRWPTNLVLIHTPECRKAGTRKIRLNGSGMATEPKAGTTRPHNVYGDSQYKGRVVGYSSGDGTETIPAWDCQEGCPVPELDRQSGNLKVPSVYATADKGMEKFRTKYGGNLPQPPYKIGCGDEGGTSRFYPQFANRAEFMGWLGRLLGGVE